MTARRCSVHGNPFRDATICPDCVLEVEKDLAEVPALAEDLDITISRQTAVGYREGGRSAEEPLPFNVNASTVATELHATLAGWVRTLQDVYGGLAPANDLTALSRFLFTRIPLIRQHPDAVQLRDEIGYAVDQARRAVDRPKNRSRVFVGVCLEDCCDGELWARFPLADFDPNDPATHAAITCTGCAVKFQADQWIGVGKRLLREKKAS